MTADEVSIHRKLTHKNIVKFIHLSHDDNFVYIIMELCSHNVSIPLNYQLPHYAKINFFLTYSRLYILCLKDVIQLQILKVDSS